MSLSAIGPGHFWRWSARSSKRCWWCGVWWSRTEQIRGMLREFGLAVPKGEAKLRRQLSQILKEAGNGLPALAREVLAGCWSSQPRHRLSTRRMPSAVVRCRRHGARAQWTAV